jgi:hypothetical protein
MDIDILSEIKKRQEKIAKLEGEISAMKTVAEMFGLISGTISTNGAGNGNGQSATAVHKVGTPKWHKTIGDAAEDILRELNTPGLTLSELHQRLAEESITPTLDSLDAALRKDTKQRFRLVGVRTYGLRRN